jgi:hypothetical protein
MASQTVPEPKRGSDPISLSSIPKDITMDVVDLPLEQIIPYARKPTSASRR